MLRFPDRPHQMLQNPHQIPTLCYQLVIEMVTFMPHTSMCKEMVYCWEENDQPSSEAIG